MDLLTFVENLLLTIISPFSVNFYLSRSLWASADCTLDHLQVYVKSVFSWQCI